MTKINEKSFSLIITNTELSDFITSLLFQLYLVSDDRVLCSQF